MPRVDFYVTQATGDNASLQLVCKIINKAYTQQQGVYVHCANKAQAQQLDDMLWLFDDISFIPHALANATLKQQPPVLIGDGTHQPSSTDILINLHPELPAKPEQFSRIIEIVLADDACKKISRRHYKAYQTLEFPLKSHTI